MRASQDALNLGHRLRDLSLGWREHIDRAEVFGVEHPEPRRIERDHHFVIRILKSRRPPAGREDTNYLELDATNTDRLTRERLRGARRQVGGGGCAEHGHSLAAIIVAA